MSERPDANLLIREAQALAHSAQALAERGANRVAIQSAGHFLQSAFDAYRSRDAEQVRHNVEALRLLVAELRARTPQA